jgi:biopolymer transport protein ExbD
MVMPLVYRSIFLSFTAVAVTGAGRAMDEDAAPKTAEYKRADTNFYARGDILKAHSASAILTKDKYTQKDDSYFYTPKIKALKEIYIEIASDWIEPITPPDMPASLNIAPDAMQIREPQGDVTVALPTAPGNFATVTDGMSLPNGAVIKTGPNATAAILFGGVDSARLMPDSEAAVQQTVTAQTRTVEVDLTAGGVFSKVGTQIGVKGDYEVHTSSGNALAHGTDFVTMIAQGHTDVWISQGTVELIPPDAKNGESVTSDGTGPLKLLRFPAITDPTAAILADANGLTAILNFIPMANQKIAALRAQVTRGTALSATQQAYLNRIKQVPAFIKLALVEPPPPPVAPPPAPPAPETIVVHPNGTIKFLGTTMGLSEFQEKLKALIKEKPEQAIIIKASPKVPYATFQDVVTSCNDAQVKTVTVATPAPQPPPAPNATPTAETPPAVPAPPTVVTPPPAPVPPPPLVIIGLDATGTTFIDAAPVTEDELKSKVAELAKANAQQEFILVKKPKVTHDQWQKIVDICHAANLKVHVKNEEEYHASTSLFPAVVVPPPAPAPVPPPPPPPPVIVGLDASGTTFVDAAPITEDALKAKLADLAQANAAQEIILVKRDKVTHDQWQKIVDDGHAAKLKVHVKDEADYHSTTALFPPATPPPPPVILGLDATGTTFLDTAPITEEALKAKLTDLATANAEQEIIVVKREKVSHDQWQKIVDDAHAAKLKVRVKDEADYHSATALFPPVVPPPPPPPPVVIGLDATGTTFMDSAPVTEDALKTKLADLATANPEQEIILVKRKKVTSDQWQKIVDDGHAAKLKVHVKDEADYHSTTALFPPVVAPPPPPPPAPPVVIGLDAVGTTFVNGAPITEDDLKAKLADLAKANPEQEVTLVKRTKVTHAQWQKIVDLGHAAKLKVHVQNEKEYKASASLFPPGEPAVPPTPTPTAETPPTTPPVTPTPATTSSEETTPIAVIGLQADGSMTLDGTPVTADVLKTELDDISKTNPTDPLLLLKMDKVTHDQWQNVVDICHAANLKVRVVNAKDYHNPALPASTPPLTTPTAETPPATPSEVPRPHLSAAPAPEKPVPVEIDLKPDGTMTLDGAPVTSDELKAKLAEIANVNPQQPLLLVKTDQATHVQIDQIVAICHGAKLKVHIKTAKAFTPPAPSTTTTTTPEVPSSPAPNLAAPSLIMHPAMQPMPRDSTPPPPTTHAPPPASP